MGMDLAALRRYSRTCKVVRAINGLKNQTEPLSAEVQSLMQLAAGRWAEAVLRQLWQDSNEDVTTTAFFELEKAGALTKPELQRIIKQSPVGSLRYHVTPLHDLRSRPQEFASIAQSRLARSD